MDIGGKIANRVTDVAVQGIVATHAKLAGHKANVGALILDNFFRLVSSEIRATTGKLWTPIADADDAPEWARDMFGFLARGEGQWQTFLAGNAVGAVMGGGLMDLITNELAPVVHRLVQANPHAFLSPGDAARAAALRIWSADSAYGDAAGAGIDRDRFNALVQMSYVVPTMEQALEMVNRGVLPAQDARTAFLRAGMHPDYVDRLLSLARVELPPATVADMVVRNVTDHDTGAAVAARSGVVRDDFDRMVAVTGEPPALDVMLRLHRRGAVSDDRLVRAIRQSRVRDEWIDVIRQADVVPMSTADAIETVIKGHLPEADGQRIATENGLMPEHWAPLLAAAGNPPGLQEMLSWWRRRILTEDQVDQGIRESRLNNKWMPYVKAASEVLPPLTTIRSMYHAGEMTRDRALELLLRHGWAVDVANTYLDAVHSNKSKRTRDLTAEQALQLYELRQMDRPAAHDILTAMGYDDTEAEQRLDLVDLARVRQYVDAVIRRMHAGYTRYLIDENEVTSTLDRLGVTPDARTRLLTLWDVERATVTRTLTEAQVVAMLKARLIDETEAVQRHLAMGYGERDAQLLVDHALGRKGA